MADFDVVRDRLNRLRDADAQAVDAIAAARTSLRRAEDEAAAAARTGRQSPELDAAVDDARAALKAREERRAATRIDVRVAVKDFGLLSDPRTAISHFVQDVPVLLFPVRLETRFRTVTDAPGVVRDQLWVRVYPDTCLIDTFEESLSTTEVASGRQYWREVWRAGGIEADERAAWRNVVASHGSGRAGWIVDTYRPTNEPERPTKAAPTDLILVVSTTAPLLPAERAAIAAYWVAIWRADGNAVAAAAASTALRTAVGTARADELVALTKPFNLADDPTPPRTHANATVNVAFLEVPDPPAKDQSWSQAPRVRLFPERFVLIAELGGTRVERLGEPVPPSLLVGPDPSAPPADQLEPQGGNLRVPDELQWLVDFDRAVDVGLGFRVDLTPDQARAGFDRLAVLGVRLADDRDEGRKHLEGLLANHRRGRNGFSLVPVGTPTNNTEGTSSGFTRTDDADLTFDLRKTPVALAPESDWRKKRDGEWLAEGLGIDPATLETTPHASGFDQRDGRAVNAALWPGTLGYFLGTMLRPVLSDGMIEQTRRFFEEFVSGRGRLPSVRIGSQPYGILPTTAFSRIDWIAPPTGAVLVGHVDDQARFLFGLRTVLGRADADWAQMAEQVAAVARPGDPHQELLTILSLYPSSTEYHYRYAESAEHLFNHLNFLGLGSAFLAALAAWAFEVPAVELLRRLGYSGRQMPEILSKYFLAGQGALDGPVVDDRPLSERDPIRVWTGDGHDYLAWLSTAATTSLDALRREQGFIDDTPPKALLYLLLRHALILGYADAGRELYRSAGFDPDFVAALHEEPAFVHVNQGSAVSESRFAPLYAKVPQIAVDPNLTVAAFIASQLSVAPETQTLRDQLEAISLLQGTSTARLERALAEHIDCCSYRLDAWWLGLVALQLDRLRRPDPVAAPRQGIYLGAYGWLENVRPKPRDLTPVELPPDLVPAFGGATEPPLMRDAANGGYVLAPSQNQAITAAVLRNGYLSNATPASPDAMAVNLSSDRVRASIGILEGIRNGQSLGALLGYQLERGLHDRHTFAEVDQFILAIRTGFPLVANKLASTVEGDASIEALEARNVVDGLRLVEQIRSTGHADYPFGLDLDPATASTSQRLAIRAEVDALLDVFDALGDLALSEGVHQAVQGNFDRVASTLAAYSTGHYPPEPEVVRTPAVGALLTHRVGLHLRPGLGAPAGATPRSVAEPALDRLAQDVLPPLNLIGCRVAWNDPVTGDPETEPVTMAQLGLRPIDLLSLVRSPDAAMTELDDRLVRHVQSVRNPRPDTRLEIRYLEHAAGTFSVFEVSALIDRLRSVIVRARPLRPGDVAIPGEATKDLDELLRVDRARVAAVLATAQTLLADVVTMDAAFTPLPAPAALIAGIDTQLDDTRELLVRAAVLGMPETGWGFAIDWRRVAFAGLVRDLRARASAWDTRLDRFADRFAAYQLLPTGTPADVLMAALREAESAISPTLDPSPATPAALEAAVFAKRTAFDQRRLQLLAVADSATAGLAPLIAAVRALLPLTSFDVEPFDLADLEERVVGFAGDLATSVTRLRSELEHRTAQAAAALTAHDAAAPGRARIDALQEAAQALLGEDFRLIPEFSLPPAQADEWQLAYDTSRAGDLLDHLATATPIDFPVDEWLYGVARVREPLRHLEQVLMLAGAFDRAEPELTPIQLPYRPGQRWLALEYPPDQEPDGERLLYTAWYTVPFAKAASQCGLLIDEWTEVLPNPETTAGLTFHYDQPSAEAPQSMLLVTPATRADRWVWDDLYGAVRDTFELARKRAVEPAQIDASAYARFVPATVMATTVRGISIGLTLAANTGAHAFIRPEALDG